MPSINGPSNVFGTANSTGTGSIDFDTKALVEAKLQPRMTQIKRLTDEVQANTTKTSAYYDLRNKLATLNNAATALRAAPDSVGRTVDVFRARAASLTSSAGADATAYLSASTKDGTALGNHDISITRIAKANILAAAGRSSASDALGWSGKFVIGAEGGTGAKISVDPRMSLADIAGAINAETVSTKVTASVMKISDNTYQLVLTAKETGKTIRLSDADGSTLLADSSKLGVLDRTGTVKADAVLQAAQKAEFSVDGVTLTRSNNDIDDVFDGVTLHLYGVPPAGTTLKLKIDHDLNAVKKAVSSFVESYNSLRDIVIANQATKSDGTANGGTALFGDMHLRTIATDAQNILSSSVDGIGLAELGIRLDSQNKLTVEESALNGALLNRFRSVETLFSYNATISSGDLTLLRHPNSEFSFELNISVAADGKLTGANIGGDSSMFSIEGSTIVGKAGTPYTGLTLLYTGNTSKTISVKLTQGMADRMHELADSFANSDSGSLSVLLSSLRTAKDDLNGKIDGIKASAQSYANSLYKMYGNMAARISQAQTTIKLLKALLKSGSD